MSRGDPRIRLEFTYALSLPGLLCFVDSELTHDISDNMLQCSCRTVKMHLLRCVLARLLLQIVFPNAQAYEVSCFVTGSVISGFLCTTTGSIFF